MSPDQFANQVQLTNRTNRLAWYEREIEKRGRAFAEILRELRDDTLKPYLATHDSLTAYLEERWGMTPRRQNQLLAAQNVREQLASDDPEIAGVVMNMREGPVRELASGVPPEKRGAVLRDAIKSAPKGRLTANTIKQAKARVIEPAPIADPVLEDEPETLPPAANVPHGMEEAIKNFKDGKVSAPVDFAKYLPKCCPHCGKEIE